MKRKEERFYLPLLSLSSKNLDLDFGLRRQTTSNEQIANLGYDYIFHSYSPSHMRHKKWCGVFYLGPTNKRCTCLLQNNSKPAENLLRVEYSSSKMINYLKLAGFAKLAGASECANDIFYCLDKQMNIDPKKRAIALTYPCLRTEWTKGISEKFTIQTNDMLEKNTEGIITKIEAKKTKLKKVFLEVGKPNEMLNDYQFDKKETKGQKLSQNGVIYAYNDENHESSKELAHQRTLPFPNQTDNNRSENNQEEYRPPNTKETVIINYNSNDDTEPLKLVATKGRKMELDSKTLECDYSLIYEEKNPTFLDKSPFKEQEATTYKTKNNEFLGIHFGIEQLKIKPQKNGFVPVIKHNNSKKVKKEKKHTRLLKVIPRRTYFISQNAYGMWCRKNLKTVEKDKDDQLSTKSKFTDPNAFERKFVLPHISGPNNTIKAERTSFHEKTISSDKSKAEILKPMLIQRIPS